MGSSGLTQPNSQITQPTIGSGWQCLRNHLGWVEHSRTQPDPTHSWEYDPRIRIYQSYPRYAFSLIIKWNRTNLYTLVYPRYAVPIMVHWNRIVNNINLSCRYTYLSFWLYYLFYQLIHLFFSLYIYLS